MRIYVVDDDKIIRMGITSIIEDSGKDYTVVGQATNGEEALEDIKRLKPDVVITDIKMPVMDGMELIKCIGDLDFQVKFIVLSGFDEYKYVRESMKKGAEDYLLKPIDDDALIEVLDKIHNDIKEKQIEEQKQVLHEKKVKQSNLVLKEKFLKEIIYSDEQYIEKETLKIFDLEKDARFVFILISLDDFYEKEIGEYKLEVSQIRNKEFDEIKYQLLFMLNTNYGDKFKNFIAYKDNEILILLSYLASEESIIIDNALECAKSIRQTISKNYNYSMTTGISKIFYNIRNAKNAYLEASSVVEGYFYEYKREERIFSDNQFVYGQIDEKELDKIVEDLSLYTELCDLNKIKGTLEEIMTKSENNKVKPSILKKFLLDFMSKIYNTIPDYKYVMDYVAKYDYDIENYINKINRFAELRSYFINMFCHIVLLMSNVRAEKSTKIIEMAKEYIQRNYQGDISLKVVSDYVHLNSSYLSVLFKQETGKNFTDYLIEVRINKAKELLKEPRVRISEVGEAVGYSEPVSFNRAFKKLIGMSPKEYVKLLK